MDELPKAVIETGRSGWYLRVLTEGLVAPGETLRVVERHCPQFSIARVNRLRYQERSDRAAERQLAECALLSTTWRAHFAKRQ